MLPNDATKNRRKSPVFRLILPRTEEARAPVERARAKQPRAVSPHPVKCAFSCPSDIGAIYTAAYNSYADREALTVHNHYERKCRDRLYMKYEYAMILIFLSRRV